ncbi:uncharacterized protein METZ01_LOCUS106100, partial [marine metagenome]
MTYHEHFQDVLPERSRVAEKNGNSKLWAGSTS